MLGLWLVAMLVVGLEVLCFLEQRRQLVGVEPHPVLGAAVERHGPEVDRLHRLGAHGAHAFVVLRSRLPRNTSRRASCNMPTRASR
jgi:hypothetical protein